MLKNTNLMRFILGFNEKNIDHTVLKIKIVSIFYKAHRSEKHGVL